MIDDYRRLHHRDFFADYRAAIAANLRMDERKDLPASLVVWQDANVMLFVPKAQTSQWELQLMTLPNEQGFLPGNILECDKETRKSLDTGILVAQKALAGLGAKMVTSIEYGKGLTAKTVSPCSTPCCRACPSRPAPSARLSFALSTAIIRKISPRSAVRQLA